MGLFVFTFLMLSSEFLRFVSEFYTIFISNE